MAEGCNAILTCLYINRSIDLGRLVGISPQLSLLRVVTLWNETWDTRRQVAIWVYILVVLLFFFCSLEHETKRQSDNRQKTNEEAQVVQLFTHRDSFIHSICFSPSIFCFTIQFSNRWSSTVVWISNRGEFIFRWVNWIFLIGVWHETWKVIAELVNNKHSDINEEIMFFWH